MKYGALHDIRMKWERESVNIPVVKILKCYAAVVIPQLCIILLAVSYCCRIQFFLNKEHLRLDLSWSVRELFAINLLQQQTPKYHAKLKNKYMCFMKARKESTVQLPILTHSGCESKFIAECHRASPKRQQAIPCLKLSVALTAAQLAGVISS